MDDDPARNILTVQTAACPREPDRAPRASTAKHPPSPAQSRPVVLTQFLRPAMTASSSQLLSCVPHLVQSQTQFLGPALGWAGLDWMELFWAVGVKGTEKRGSRKKSEKEKKKRNRKKKKEKSKAQRLETSGRQRHQPICLPFSFVSSFIVYLSLYHPSPVPRSREFRCASILRLQFACENHRFFCRHLVLPANPRQFGNSARARRPCCTDYSTLFFFSGTKEAPCFWGIGNRGLFGHQ